MKPIIVVLCTVLSLHVASYAQWEQTSGPDGGYVRSFVCDGSKVFAATGGGVLFSGDDGQSWEFRNTGLTRCDTKCLAMLDGCVYVSTDENIFHTCDDGLTWSANSDDVEGFYGKYLLNHGGTLLEGTYLRGVLRSTDAGETWVPANGGLPAKYVYYLATDGPRVFAATYHNGMYRTEDDGDTWTAINSGLSDWDVMSVHCFGGKVFISTLYDGAFVSTNNGDTWSPTATSLSSVKGFADHNGLLYAASFGGGVYVSADTGQTWSTWNTGLGETDIWAIGISDTRVYVGVSSGHVYARNLAGGSWSLSCNLGFDACAGSVSSSGSNLVAGTHGSGFFVSGNEGASWSKVSSIWTVETRGMISSGATVFAGTDMLGIFKSTDYGVTFSMANTGLGSAWIQAFAICGGRVFAGSGEAGVFVSANAGSSWTAANTGLTSLNTLSLASDGTRVYAGTSDSGLFVSSDLGGTWSPANVGVGSLTVTAIQCSGGHVFAGTRADGLYRSDDNGATWSPPSEGLPGDANIGCLHASGDALFAGTGEGKVYVSYDSGDRWADFSSGLPGSAVLSLHVYNGYLYAGLNAGGVWRQSVSEPHGACCGAAGVCTQETQWYCETAHGLQYMGDGISCDPSPCDTGCCVLRADIDHSGAGPDITDLVYLVNYMFKDGPEPQCMAEADVNASGSYPDIADLVYLVGYMFKSGPAPVPCGG